MQIHLKKPLIATLVDANLPAKVRLDPVAGKYRIRRSPTRVGGAIRRIDSPARLGSLPTEAAVKTLAQIGTASIVFAFLFGRSGVRSFNPNGAQK